MNPIRLLMLRFGWRSLRVVSGVQERLRRRFTSCGRVVIATTATAALLGIDTRQTLAYQVFALGAALLAVAWLMTLRRPRGIEAERLLPRHASVGEPLRYSVQLHNRGKHEAARVELIEALPDPRPTWRRFVDEGAAAERDIKGLDRWVAYPRWRWLVDRRQIAERPAARSLPPLPPGRSHREQLTIEPKRRGVLRFEALGIAQVDALRLARRSRPVGRPQQLLVLPRRYRIPPLHQAGRQKLQPGGVNLAGSVGESREFMGLRDYLPGDSPRHIDWAAWARCGEPVVREYQDEFFSRQALILDSFPTDAPAHVNSTRAFECAVSVAASFVEPLTGDDALLDLMFVADRAYTLTGGRSLMSSQGMLEVLAAVEPPLDQQRGFDELAHVVNGHAARLSACLLVLLAWDEARQNLVRELRALSLPVRVLIIGGPARPAPGPLADLSGALTRIDIEDPQTDLLGIR